MSRLQHLELKPWIDWTPRSMPVAAHVRVEVRQWGGRWAEGVACAFDWQWRGDRCDWPTRWRLAEPRSQAEPPA